MKCLVWDVGARLVLMYSVHLVNIMYNEITTCEETHSINPHKSKQFTNPNFRNSAGLRSHSLSLSPAGVA